jgi:hypothetical protein
MERIGITYKRSNMVKYIWSTMVIWQWCSQIIEKYSDYAVDPEQERDGPQ